MIAGGDVGERAGVMVAVGVAIGLEIEGRVGVVVAVGVSIAVGTGEGIPVTAT
jgi:hypothetical protein